MGRHVIDSWPLKERECAHLRLLPQVLPAGNGGHNVPILCVGSKRIALLLERWGFFIMLHLFPLYIQVHKNSKQSISENYKARVHIKCDLGS